MQQSPVSLEFPLPDVVITSNTTPPHWAFYVQDSEVSVCCYVTWSGSIYNVHIALQELKTVVRMVHIMTSWLSNKVVGLHFDNSPANAFFM